MKPAAVIKYKKFYMILTLTRTFREALNNFWRNSWLTVASVSVLIMSLYVVSLIYVTTYTANSILENIQQKVNVSVYFKSDVTEERILLAKDDFSKMSEIKSINYVSREKALEDFKAKNANEPVILKSLEEIGENPLLASLIIKAQNSNQYQPVIDSINQSQYIEDVSRINYGKNKEIIDKLNSVIATIRRVGIALGILFSLIAILITFNTIRITIYTHKPEIEVMRLVGASNAFIRLPFIFEGIIYGLVASVISMIILFITLRFLTPYISSVIPTSSLVSFYTSSFLKIFLLQATIGIALGILSSLVAIRKYLKI